jgi:beta-lactam-binding protein with PASTA domain/tRNA A-37 threonylcarbamoyl transferase component Bud32
MAVGQQVYSNRYEVVRGIARGGMSEVYLAHDRHLDRPVALKVLTSALSRDPSFVERFRREAQAAANLSHPNIVAVYDWGQEEGTYFIVMEYIDGHSLRDVLRTQTTIEASRAAGIAAEVANGLSFAHRAGVVHRDVKPGNVLIEASGQVKVTDFGVARADASEALTQTGSVMGTATYFSPEQAQGLVVDGRSDVYSLGVVLYEMVCGTAPFAGENPVSVAYQHVREPVPSLRAKRPDVPAGLEQIIMTALEKDPDRRYQSADDLRADLLRFRRGREIVGGPLTGMVTEIPSAGATAAGGATQVQLPVAAAPDADGRKRSPWAVAAVVVVLLALVGGAAFLVTRELDSTSGGGAADVEVPNVITQPPMDITQARKILEDAGFTVSIDPIVSDSAAAGAVITQTPAGGTTAKEGDDIRLGVSRGPADARIPDVTGSEEGAAIAEIEAAGFSATTTTEANRDVPEGRVIRTEPAPGELQPRGSNVVVVVSSGGPSVEVPDVAGQSESAAANRLGQAGFQVRTSEEASDSVDSGNVIRTEPGAGAQAPESSTVTIVVSTGPARISVPDVVGNTQSAAEQAIAAAGLSVTVQKVASTPSAKGIVSGQSPGGGSSVGPGSAVTIQVGDGSLPGP